MIAALEAVRELVKEGRRLAREAADKHGDTYGQLSEVFGTATNPKATRALDRLGQAAESISEADGHTAVALDDIGEYIEVVKGNGPSSGGVVSGAGPASERVPTPQNPAPFHRQYFDALSTRTKDDDPTDGTLTTVDGEKIEDVKSGQRGPGRGGPGLLPKFAKMFTVADHAEGHAAALMRTSEVRHATLYINNKPCDYVPFGCDRILPHILRKGDTLTVYGPDGYVKVYIGNGKGLA